MSIEPGTLYVVATPIGHLADLSLRAVETLKSVDIIAAEDTRHSRKLLQHYGISCRLISLHEHNEEYQYPSLIGLLESGCSVALVSDAGTPLISDPGYRLVAAARRAGLTVTPIPGPSSVIAALSVSGLPTDRFAFEGFLPAKPGPRRRRLRELAGEPRTLVLFESSHRIAECIADASVAFGEDREAVVARELTKTFESVESGTLGHLSHWIHADPVNARGEFVLMVRGAPETAGEGEQRAGLQVLEILLNELPLKRAAALAARITGQSRNALYRQGLALSSPRQSSEDADE